MAHKTRWDDLQYIYAVARHGSLSGAAKELGVNHATVLRRITAAEAFHKVTIFDRPPGGYRVRPEGRDLFETLKTIGRSVDHLERMLPTIGKGLEGSFRITTTDSLANLILPSHLSTLQRIHSKLTVELVVSNTPRASDQLDAEISIRPAPALPSGLEGRSVAKLNLTAYSAEGVDKTAPWLRLAGPLERSPAGVWQAEQGADAMGISADSFSTLARLAEAGLGRVILPCFIGDVSPQLKRIKGAPRFNVDLWVLAHPDLLRSERVQVVIEFFTTALAKDQRLLV